MRPPHDRHALRDPRIAWTVLLTATLDHEPAAIDARLAALAEQNDWASPYPLAVTTGDNEITLAAGHSHLDGQAMLAALSFLLDSPVRSLAGGVTATRTRSSLGLAGIRRVGEVVARPSAVVPGTSTDRPDADAHDVMVRLQLPRSVSTSDLVVAAARAIADRASGPISVAVGVAGPVDSTLPLADRSGYLRIRDARGITRPEVSRFLKSAPLQPGGTAPTGTVGALVGLGTRLLANRLGSTILVTHLGELQTDAVSDLVFYPLSGGASGLALGAATIHGHTTLGLRGRGARHDADGLQRLLEAIARALDDA